MSSNNPHGARSSEQQQILRLWGDLPIVEAKHDVRVVLAPEDGRNAKRGDGENCLLAQACRRSFGSTKVVFFRRVAYVELPDARGNPRIERFMLSEDAHNAIREFDQTGKIAERASFNLKAPGASQRLESQRKWQAKYERDLREGRREINPKKRAANKKGAKNRPIIVGNHLLRSGQGDWKRTLVAEASE